MCSARVSVTLCARIWLEYISAISCTDDIAACCLGSNAKLCAQPLIKNTAVEGAASAPSDPAELQGHRVALIGHGWEGQRG